MKRAAKSKTGAARPGFPRQGWSKRVYPVFQRYWLARRKNRELPGSGNPDRKFQQWFREFSAASREMDDVLSRIKNPIRTRVMAAVLKPLDIEGRHRIDLPWTGADGELISYPVNPEASGLFRMLVFLKHGTTFRELIHKVDIEKDDSAHKKLMSVHRDYWAVLTTKHFEDLKLKFNWDHFEIITHGLDFGLDGIDEYELADCLDNICPCRQKHSATYLKKLRTAIKQTCNRLIRETQGGTAEA